MLVLLPIAIPRELIQEIMDQGHGWDDAILYALMVRADPLRNDSDHIELWPRMGKKIVLKPLKHLKKAVRSIEMNKG